ncbi:protein FAM124A-like [Cyprinus carpio]|uniref:Protein FAM124A-like n=1 Tax=Cyprinus carpio TaxID=7962 RepID=A0A9Q9YUJ4_CYPCA|nr:protein FAM124A-like [Cyprinus carpio]
MVNVPGMTIGAARLTQKIVYHLRTTGLSPLHDYARANQHPAAGHPSHAVTIFLHESYGEERILRVLDFLQCPPWQYHHTEASCQRDRTSSCPYCPTPGSPISASRWHTEDLDGNKFLFQ